MKKTILVVLVLVLALCGQAQFTSARLQATGLTCALCSKAVNNSLLKVNFVESVKADIRNSAFEIVFKSSVPVDIDALKKAVEDAGFSIGGLKLTGTFTGVKIASDQHVQIGDKEFCFLNVNDQMLNGPETLTIVDKNFITPKEFKKLSASTKMSCLQTGKSGACCGLDPAAAPVRVYHVTI